MNAIEVRGLTRRFGAFAAVRDLTFDVRQGEIFGFLGSNGAGKSTTIRMLCGLLRPTAGIARVGGIDVGRDPEAVKEDVLDELVSVQRARDKYGVVLTGTLDEYDLAVDVAATQALRAQMNSSKAA